MKKEYVSIRIEKDVHTRLKFIAEYTQESINKVANRIIAQGVSDEETEMYQRYVWKKPGKYSKRP